MLLNLLSVAAAYGLLVVVFRWDVGAGLLGLRHADEIEGWIPIVLFAALFGISMDYEVFLVSRMREAWDELPDNARAVAHGLQRTGRVVTAAAAIMVGAFSGFAAGDVTGLQQFGVGLVLAVLIDATIVRAVLLPSLMTRARAVQLVAAGLGRTSRPRGAVPAGGTLREGLGGAPLSDPWEVAYLTTLIASRKAGIWYPAASPGASVAYARSGTMPSCGYGYAGCCV